VTSRGNSNKPVQNLGIGFRPRKRLPSPLELASMGSSTLRAAQHAPEMFRRSLPTGAARSRLDRLSNRLTKIATEARKLDTP
jgi:hypothetical protein